MTEPHRKDRLIHHSSSFSKYLGGGVQLNRAHSAQEAHGRKWQQFVDACANDLKLTSTPQSNHHRSRCEPPLVRVRHGPSLLMTKPLPYPLSAAYVVQGANRAIDSIYAVVNKEILVA